MKQKLYEWLIYHGLDLGLVNLFHNQRNGYEQIGLYIGKGFHQGCRSRGGTQPVDGCAVAERIEELYYQSVHMGHGEH